MAGMYQTAYILDLLFDRGSLSPELQINQQPLWFNVHADGLPQPFSTPQATCCTEPRWNYPVRLVLHFKDLYRAYLYLTLCSYDAETGSTVQAIARSRVGLRSFPVGKPKTFSIPLMDANNSARNIANIKIVATLAVFSVQPQQIPIHPGSAFQSVPIPPTSGMFPQTQQYHSLF